jgi:exodeoxyribonuclease VII large subunit
MVHESLAFNFESHGARLGRCLVRRQEDSRERLDRLCERWPHPQALFQPAAALLADPARRLPRALAARAAFARGDLGETASRLRRALLDTRIERSAERLASLWRLAGLAHPERPLSRGFARVTDDEGRTLMTAAAAGGCAHLELRFADGSVGAIPDSAAGIEPRKASAYRRPRQQPAQRQPGLFDES